MFCVKRSKGLTKEVHIGNTVYKSKSLCILKDPYKDMQTFTLEVGKKGCLILKQDPSGSLVINIDSNITLPAKDEAPTTGNYMVCTVHTGVRKEITNKVLYAEL